MSPRDDTGHPIFRLLQVMARLRDPDGGCPWDLEQNFSTIAPYTIEEAYEVADAIETGDMEHLKEELGDLLLQVVYHARMAEEVGSFAFTDVAQTITDKMIRRHPHVFGEDEVESSADQTSRWEAIKAAERKARADAHEAAHSALDGVPVGLPALTRAHKLTARAARVGFDWPSEREVLDKLAEEIAELEVEIAAGDRAKAREEVGDMLFVIANLARKLEVETEHALRAANAKFTRRFHHIEARLAEGGRTAAQSDLAEMDGLWDEAKRVERGG